MCPSKSKSRTSRHLAKTGPQWPRAPSPRAPPGGRHPRGPSPTPGGNPPKGMHLAGPSTGVLHRQHPHLHPHLCQGPRNEATTQGPLRKGPHKARAAPPGASRRPRPTETATATRQGERLTRPPRPFHPRPQPPRTAPCCSALSRLQTACMDSAKRPTEMRSAVMVAAGLGQRGPEAAKSLTGRRNQLHQAPHRASKMSGTKSRPRSWQRRAVSSKTSLRQAKASRSSGVADASTRHCKIPGLVLVVARPLDPHLRPQCHPDGRAARDPLQDRPR